MMGVDDDSHDGCDGVRTYTLGERVVTVLFGGGG